MHPAIGIAVSRHSGSQLATMLMDRFFNHSFFPFYPSSSPFHSLSQHFIIGRSLGPKKLFRESLREPLKI